jgi:hypothetical protein
MPLLRSGQTVNPAAFYNAEPAPIGIADYGVDGTGAGYGYNTTTFVGELQFGNISTRNASLAYGREFTIQLNVVLEFRHGATTYSYWIQDVADLNTSNNLIVFLDNVWNFSSGGGALPSSSFTGNGTFVASPSYYYDVASGALAGNWANLVYPTKLGLRVVSSDVGGVPRVAYEYNDTGRWITFDNLAFGWAGGASDHGFVVNGTAYNPRGLFDDSELILGGPGGGSATEAFGARIIVNLLFWNGHNFQKILNAYNHGSDTAEAIWNLTARGFHYTSNGTLFGYLTGGAGSVGRLYSRSLVSLLNVSVPFPNGELFLNGTDYGPFIGGEANVTVGPGTYLVGVDRNGSLYGTRTVPIPAASYVALNFTNATRYGVWFNESGLPPGDPWSVTFGGSARGSSSSSIAFTSANGSVGYSVSVPAGYSASPSSGTVVVSGASAAVSIRVSRVDYAVNFTESGLPAGTFWSVTVNGSLLSGTGLSLVASEPNGSYPFLLGRVAGWQPSPGSGSVLVVGSARSITILFTQVEYIVTFDATGLPNTLHWAFAFAGLNYSSNQSLLSVLVPNGTYPFQVFPVPGYTESPASGTVVVDGAGASQPFDFVVVAFPIYVNETGLPPGSPWNLTLDGVPSVEVGGAVVLHAPNGTHRLQVGPVPGFWLPVSRFSLSVQGHPVAVAPTFHPFTYLITFGASGLPAGAPWSVTVHAGTNEVTNVSNGTIVAFDLPNGSFTYSVLPPPGFGVNPGAGTGSVAASPLGILLSFAPLPGSVIGTVDPAGATVLINGTPISSSNGAFNVSLAPGTYLLHVSAPGYGPYSENLTVRAGNTTPVHVTLSPLATPGASPAISGVLWLGLAGVIAAVAAVAVIAARRRRPAR